MTTLYKIEKGKKEFLGYGLVNTLAKAIGLHDEEADEFFRVAGLVHKSQPERPRDWPTIALRFHKSFDLPAIIFDQFFDILWINSYLLDLFRLELETISKHTLFSSAGVNTLRFLFDPMFRARDLYQDGWWQYAVENVYLFKKASEFSVQEPRYSQVLKELRKFDFFDEAWEEAEYHEPIPPYSATIHRNDTRVTYFHLEMVMPSRFDLEMNAVLYFPADIHSEKVFDDMRTKHKRIYQFTTDSERGYKEFF